MASAAASVVVTAVLVYVFRTTTLHQIELTIHQWGSWCCTPCLYGRASQRLDIYPTNDTEQIDTCDTNCWLFCLTGTMFLHWIPMTLKRTALREHFNIEGDVCRDGMVSLVDLRISFLA